MLDCVKKELPKEKQEAMQSVLSDIRLGIVRAVVEGKVRFHQVAALNHALKAGDWNPERMEVAKDALRQAHRYQDFLDVLSELQKKAEGWELIEVPN